MRSPSAFAIAGGEGLSLAAVAFLVTLLCGVPLALLFAIGLTGEGGGLTLGPLAETLASRSVQRALWNSLESSFLSACLATVLGTVLALALGLTNVRAKAPLVFLILLPMMIPPHVTAIAWSQALGPASPVLQALGLAPAAGAPHPVYSLTGLVALLSFQHMPIVFLVVRAGLRAFPRELSDAARVSGARAPRLLWRITLPLLAPSLLAGFVLAFVSALGNFGINALIGIPARYTTLPVLIWRRLAGYGPSVIGDVALISILLGIVTLGLVAIQVLLQRRMRNALVGLPQQPLAVDLGRARLPVEATVWLLLAATLLLPALSLFATSMMRTYGLPLAASSLTLENYAEILFRQAVTLRAFANSTVAAALAALLIAGLSILLGYFLAMRRGMARRLAGLVAAQADVAYAVPGLVMSIAFILMFLRPLPVLGVSLYGTMAIILLAYVAVFLAIGLNSVMAAYMQVDASLDDAARVSGAGFFRRLARVHAPLVAPAAASGAILVFLTSYNEVTVSALLWSSGNETIGTTIFNYEDGGYTTLAAAMSSVTVVATVLVMLAVNALARHVPAGAIPWKD
ncbi:iron ABC transporter permease [Stappia sp. WLB 29]|uniref:ABC transporter permease n=1 Tax=Stappia sp. WLB 29 TaxID=2925220 RepID=UPI0020BF188E|nr:iron ABC transporter permease [Stappia sp. WLB 29]